MRRIEVLPAGGFEEALAGMGEVVVAFAADWCGFCAGFLPQFTRSAADAPEGLRFAVADVSDWDDPRWDTYRIAVVPTVIHFRDGVPVQRLDGRHGMGLAQREVKELLQTVSADHAARNGA